MFEDTLLIIKPDYLHKRRPVLLKLLDSGFQLQGSRKLNFSPELAAEFYADYADEKGFMLEVILLSKGISEAFIVSMENGVQELLNLMICYFGSASELERNVHVTKHPDSVAREITYIFPNYIHEPMKLFDSNRFCNRPMIKPLISEIYDIMQNVDCNQADWKTRVADYLVRRNPTLPQVTNQCQLVPDLCLQEKSQQTVMTYKSTSKTAKPKEKSASTTSLLPSSTPHSSVLLTTSSCVTCGGFDHSEPCITEIDLNKRVEPQSDEPICVDEEIIWKEIIVYEEVVPEEESELKSVEIVDEECEEHDHDPNCESDSDIEKALAAVTVSAEPAATAEADSGGEAGSVDEPVAAAQPSPAPEPAAAPESAAAPEPAAEPATASEPAAALEPAESTTDGEGASEPEPPVEEAGE